jgi:hypothetical protein
MSLIAEFSVSSPRLALYEATTAVPEATIELTNQVATDPERPVLFFWASCGDIEEIDSAVREDPTLTDVETYTDLGNKRFYRAHLSPEAGIVAYPVWVEAGASRLESTCSQGVWRNRFRLPDRKTLHNLRAWCLENDVSFSLHGLHRETAGVGNDDQRLTDDQIRTLTRAYEAGYYEIPRRATAADVAEDLGVSQQAVSEQLRRAYATLIEEYVLDKQ